MIELRLCALVVASCMWSGCDGRGTQSGTLTPGSSATGNDFCRSLIDQIVSAAVRCFGGSDTYWRDLYTAVMPCNHVGASLASGMMAYDSAKGADCLMRISQVSCDYGGTIDSCTQALTGRLPVGSQCDAQLAIASDCVPEGYCDSNSTACGGTCQPYVQPGGSCAYAAGSVYPTCAPGSSCQPNSDLCVRDVAEGQPCLGPSAGDCGEGLDCDGDDVTAGTCRKQQASGPCASASQCAGGYNCAGPAGATTCSRLKLPGDSCTPGQYECYAFSYCGSDGKCTSTRASENQACGSSLQNEYVPCGVGLYCAGGSYGTMGSCQKQKPAGSTCTGSYSAECAGMGATCDSTTKLCVACNSISSDGAPAL